MAAVLAAGVAGCSSGGGSAAANPAASTVSPGPVQTTDPAGANYSYAPPPSFGPGENVTFDTSSPAPNDPAVTPPALLAPQQVTYHCTGHAPDGVDITYGPSGSQHSASRLPFTRTEKLDDSAEYYVTEAQLQGGGSVSCTTTVQADDVDGSADVTSNSGSADGSFNIASAQVCSSFDGGWEKC